MTPLVVTCALMRGDFCGAPMLDSMLQATWARVHGLPPVDRMRPDSFTRIEIPIAVEPQGRFHLCSGPQYVEAASEVQWKNRAFPIALATKLCDPATVKRVHINAGAEKSYRIPHSVTFSDAIRWWCIGDADGIHELLRYVRHVGKLRGCGKGRVRSWAVEACEPWDGFPVVRDGKALRPLPPDWPGLVEPELAVTVMGSVEHAYWDQTKRELCAVAG